MHAAIPVSNHLPANTFAPNLFVSVFEIFYQRLQQAIQDAKRYNYSLNNGQPAEDIREFTLSFQKRIVKDIEEMVGSFLLAPMKSFPESVEYFKYCLVAFADEMIIDSNLSVFMHWHTSLIEGIFFQTQMSGQKIFEFMNQILKQAIPYRYDFAELMIYMLNLGFRGQYRDSENNSYINWYKRELFILIAQYNPNVIVHNHVKLFPQCYDSNPKIPMSLGLIDKRSWTALFVSFSVIYIIMSQVIWLLSTRDVYQSIKKILNYTQVQTSSSGDRKI